MSIFHTSLRMISIAGFLASGLAAADTVNLTTVTEIKTGSNTSSISSNGSVGFNPGNSLITFKVGNKTCEFNSSGNPYNSGRGAGCNYTLTYNASTGTLSNPSSNANGCTPPDKMIAACK